MSIILPIPEKNQGLIGFSHFYMAKILENTAESYEVDVVNRLPYVQSIDPPSQTADTSRIMADDEVYLEGGGPTSPTQTVTIAQLDLQRLALLEGSNVTDGTLRKSFKSPSPIPDFACSWAHLLTNGGGYRAVKRYVANPTSTAPGQITTNDGSVKVAAYTINFNFTDRAMDGAGEDVKNFAATEVAAMQTWLQDFTPAPVTP